MNIYASPLDAKVTAQNNVNAAANITGPELLAVLLPFVGQKIYKADGTLLKKVREALPPAPDGLNLSSYYEASTYSLRFHLKTWECTQLKGDRGCLAHYAEATVYLANIDKGVLTSLYTYEPRNTTRTVGEIAALRDQLKAAQRQVSEIQERLFPFGEYDR